MIVARAGSGWQTVLADLCLILFMVSAAALSRPGHGREGHNAAQDTASARSEPLALYRAGAGAPPLAQWLKDQSPDPRQQLTIVVHYRPGGQAKAFEQARTMGEAASEAGLEARTLVEPGEGDATASLAYDAPDAGLARGLQHEGQHP